MMQLVEVARAVSYNSEVLIMDEPTSALTDTETELLIKIMRDLASKGVGIIFISHKLEEILKIAYRCTVLRDGHYIGTYPCNELDTSFLIKLIANRDLDNVYNKTNTKVGKCAIEVRHLSSDKFYDVSFKVHEGEVYGLSGLMGAGRSEIVRAIFGIDPFDSGEILIDGKPVQIRNPKQAIANRMVMVTEDRLRMGAIYPFSVLHNTTLTAFRGICNKFGFYSKKHENDEFVKNAGMLSVKYSSPKELIGQLSGGNQQKVILARALMINPKILILDEPTRGIDVGSKSEIYALIDQWASQGIAIILVSSEMLELLGLSDRIGVVHNGRLVFECAGKDATQELLMQHAFGIADGQKADTPNMKM